MFTNGDRASWLNAVAVAIMDGGAIPPSLDNLYLRVPPRIVTRDSDGHVTAASKFGEASRKDMEAGWRVIIDEMVTLLREQGFVGGDDQALTWIKPADGTWQVMMPDDGRKITVFGRLERRMTQDRSVVGERNEIDGSRIGTPSAFERGRMQPFELDVLRPRGGIVPQRFELHPFAVAIPPMTEAERESLRASIERDGVKVPIVIFEKKILDGRNRAYFASMLKKPVEITEFIGTEDEARRHVAILNLHRRHLNAAQRLLAADRLFGRQAEDEAAEAMQDAALRGNQNRSPAVPKPAQPGGAEDHGRWHQRAAKLATEAGIPGIKPAGMRAIKEVRDAPETIRKIESGEITTVAKAVQAAHEEKQMPASPHVFGVNTVTVFKRLGSCIDNLSQIIVDCEMDIGRGVPLEISDRLREIHRLANDVEQILRERKIIP
jgi:ParB-like chromosome segregation protein Spo0J